jgi:hypothetical protein
MYEEHIEKASEKEARKCVDRKCTTGVPMGSYTGSTSSTASPNTQICIVLSTFIKYHEDSKFLPIKRILY